MYLSYLRQPMQPEMYTIHVPYLQGVTRRCRLSQLTNSAPRIWSQLRGEGGGCSVSANENSYAHHVTCSPNNLWRSNSIFNLCLPLSYSSSPCLSGRCSPILADGAWGWSQQRRQQNNVTLFQ